MRDLEEHLLYSDFIKADDKYISDGYFAISKEYVKSKALQICKNSENIFAEMERTVPFEQGKEFFCFELGTECKLLAHEKIGIIYNENYKFDYEYVRMINKAIPFWEITKTCVIESDNKEPVLKFFVGDKFVACLMSMKNKY